MLKRPLSGIYTALVTPFHDDGAVDEGALKTLVDDQVNHGIAGLVVGGSTGEFPALTVEERKRLVTAVIEDSAGRLPVVAGVGAMTTNESVEHAEHAKGAGADMVLLVPPYYEPLSNEEVAAHVTAVAEVGLPVMLYNNPGGTGHSLSPEFIAELGRIPGVECVKDTTPEPDRLFAIEGLGAGELEILSGQDTSTLFAFLSGRRAAVWGAGNAHPAGCVRLWQLTVGAPDRDAAVELWRAFRPLNAFFETHNYVASVRAATEIRGVAVGPPRLPIQPLRGTPLDELRRLMTAVDAALR